MFKKDIYSTKKMYVSAWEHNEKVISRMSNGDLFHIIVDKQSPENDQKSLIIINSFYSYVLLFSNFSICYISETIKNTCNFTI